jgi:hypothetical protein
MILATHSPPAVVSTPPPHSSKFHNTHKSSASTVEKSIKKPIKRWMIAVTAACCLP